MILFLILMTLLHTLAYTLLWLTVLEVVRRARAWSPPHRRPSWLCLIRSPKCAAHTILMCAAFMELGIVVIFALSAEQPLPPIRRLHQLPAVHVHQQPAGNNEGQDAIPDKPVRILH